MEMFELRFLLDLTIHLKLRYILDYPSVVCGKRVLDFGAGSGCCSIAALRSGARSALANDIDPSKGNIIKQRIILVSFARS